jgi:hypothetical protein
MPFSFREVFGINFRKKLSFYFITSTQISFGMAFKGIAFQALICEVLHSILDQHVSLHNLFCDFQISSPNTGALPPFLILPI